MTPEDIKKQLLQSAGLTEPAQPAEKHSSSAVESKAEIPAPTHTPRSERTAPTPEEELNRLVAEQIASGELISVGKKTCSKSMLLGIVLAVLFGPLGLFYVSWKRALAMLLLFIVGITLIPDNSFVTLLLWLVAPALSIIALGVGSRQPPPA